MDQSNPDDAAAETPARRQVRTSFVGEISGFACSIGAVYVAERVCPQQTTRFIGRLAEQLGRWRGTSAAVEKALAHKVADVTLMHTGGLANMATQFIWRRRQQRPEERQPLAYDVGRVVTGRAGGTVTAISALALAETFAPKLMDQGEHGAGRLLGNRPGSLRFAELALSSLVQSIGAMAGNVPAQLLYDKLLQRDRAR